MSERLYKVVIINHFFIIEPFFIMAKRRKSTNKSKKSKKTKSQKGLGIVIRMSRPRTRPFIARRVKGSRPVIDQEGGFLGSLLLGGLGTILSKILLKKSAGSVKYKKAVALFGEHHFITMKVFKGLTHQKGY